MIERRTRDSVGLRAVWHKKLQAEHEWARLKANNSLDCSNCHDFGYMDFTQQIGLFQLLQQLLQVFQVGGVEPGGEPVVDWGSALRSQTMRRSIDW